MRRIFWNRSLKVKSDAKKQKVAYYFPANIKLPIFSVEFKLPIASISTLKVSFDFVLGGMHGCHSLP